MATWQVQHAKSRLSELIEDAESKGPQTISRHGTDRAVVISMSAFQEYEALRAPKKRSLWDHLMSGPKFEDADMPVFVRSKELTREFNFDDD